jgi:hypothetical protein
LATAPESEECLMKITAKAGKFDILVTDKITIVCENKKVKSVNPVLQ